MALIDKRRSENVDGAFYVDDTCIDCDTCRWLAPNTFGRSGEQSAVYRQPESQEDALQAFQAMMACPTTSIGHQGASSLIVQARDMFPVQIAEHVFYCGFHSARSFGAASYLIQHPDGNILIDSPRFNGPLVKGIERLGGIKYLFLTHKDDVADHKHFAEIFNCERIMHKDDIDDSTRDIEIQIEGTDPYSVYDDIQVIPTPGHTKGHSILHAYNRFLFTGDHLAWSIRLKHLYAFRNHCWFDWETQIESMRLLTELPATWVLPGHGRRFQAQDSKQMQAEINNCIKWMEQEA